MKRWRVRDVMTTDVVSVDEWTPYRDIVDLLSGCRVSGLPVVDYFGHVTGVVSEADLLHRVESGGRPPRKRRYLARRRTRKATEKATGTVAGDLMTAPAVTVLADLPLAEAARAMEHAGVKRLPVVDDLGRLVGVVTRGDLLRVFLRGDAEIREDVVNEVLSRVLAVEPGTVRVSVDHGVVKLAGRLDRQSSAALAVRLSHEVAGVVDVVDRLTYDYDDRALVRASTGGHPFDAEPDVPRITPR
jgi:CBS domain-containing protein